MPRMTHALRTIARLRSAIAGAAAVLLLASPATAMSTDGHAHHPHQGAAPAGAAAPQTATEPPGASPMFVVADPRNPRIARGPRGPLWQDSEPRPVGTTSLGRTFAQRYLAAVRTRAQAPPAVRTAKGLTTAQATKKLSKKCRRLVKITNARQVQKLKKSERKARTKCLEQRRKLIADSKKDPAPAPTTPAPTTPAPAPTPTPTAPGTPAPTTPAPATPAPTTPDCAAPGPAAVSVTAIDEGSKFELSSCGASAGEVTFTFNSTDSDEDHNLVLADGVTSGGGPSGTVRVISTNITGGQSRSRTFTLAAGDYVLICTVDGHGAMTVKFKVF